MQVYYQRSCILVVLLLLALIPARTFAQCSNEALTAKYWQYKKNFDKHFILNDRDPSGCVNDGIGQDPNDPCVCTKHGYGLPATSINIEANGSLGGMDERNISSSPWYDPNCFEDDGDPSTPNTSWEDNAKHNWLDMGSETPHQMGWYWVTLATQYQLLKENGENAEAQRTLEDLFLGLQAYRRLDITANCLAAARYAEIGNQFETSYECGDGFPRSCLCPEKYRGTTTHNFDSACRGCSYIPNTSGYSGFYIREDATQELEVKLHDDSEDRWNIDLVGGTGYEGSLSPPCTSTFSQPCYLVHRQAYMSQDGVIGLMIGLAMIKRYIPAETIITTCSGQQFKPQQMAVSIASNLVNRIDEAYNNRIAWPKSRECCDKEVFFSEHDGGRAIATITGLKKAATYIDGIERHSGAIEKAAWGFLTKQTSNVVNGTAFGDNANFWVRLKTLGWDMGSAGLGSLYQEAVIVKHLEIMPLINNLLYPAEPNLPLSKETFKKLLCSAPCAGPCKKKQDYPANLPGWPDYDCSNTPEWVGMAWESHSEASDANRQFNGLDYMALYNLFMLYYPEERTPYYDPEKPNLANNHFLGESAISGPTTLCPGQSGKYTLTASNLPSTIESLVWKTSNHFDLSSTSSNPTIATFSHSTAQGYPSISAKFKENRTIPLYYTPFGKDHLEPVFQIPDYCDFSYYKPIASGLIDYTITTEFDHCAGDYWFHAIGPPAIAYSWHIIADPSAPGLQNMEFYGNGQTFNHAHPKFPGIDGMVTISLLVVNDCEELEKTITIPYKCSGSGPHMSIRIDPNPALTSISVNLVKDDQTPYIITNPNGLRVLVVPANSPSPSFVRQIYNNGEVIPISGLANGMYRMLVTAPDTDFEPLSSTFLVTH